ncbi:MAG: rhodanese-like domain-containing protein [Thermodesulfobacteriota bacterium]|nr:rhodanese-like domain-containing protein [Thermodesulfobacteriota bacterium]
MTAWNITLKEMMLLTVVAIGMALLVNSLSPNGIALMTPPSADGVPDEVAGFPVVDFQAVKNLIESGTCIFADARPADAYAEGHLPGAVSMPVYEIEDYIFSFLDTYATDMTIITYCSGINCTDSHFLSEELAAAGYEDIRIFAEGMEKWQQEGMPVEKQ